MSIITYQLPSEIYGKIFSFLPLSDIVKTSRFVCKDWEQQTHNSLTLWHKIAADIGITELATVQEVEKAVRDYFLGRGRLVLSSKEKLLKTIENLFKNITPNETRALHYICASNPQAHGFYIVTKDLAIHGRIGEKIETLFQVIGGLTITGEGEADLQQVGAVSLLTFNNIDRDGKFVHSVRIHMYDINNSIHSKYLLQFFDAPQIKK